MLNPAVSMWSVRIQVVGLTPLLDSPAGALPAWLQHPRSSGDKATGNFATTVATAGLKIVPTQAFYTGTNNAVRRVVQRSAVDNPALLDRYSAVEMPKPEKS